MAVTAERSLEWGGGVWLRAEGTIHRERPDPDWPREILKTRTLKMQFPAIWSSNFSSSSGNFTGFGNRMVQERR